jgi:hypothetical protein
VLCSHNWLRLWTDHALLQLEPWIEGFVQACACMCGCVERLLEWNAMDIQKINLAPSTNRTSLATLFKLDSHRGSKRKKLRE